MIAASCCSALLFSLLAPTMWGAGVASKSPLTVLIDFESSHSDASLRSMTKSLAQILGPTGIGVDVELKSDLPDNPQFGQLVVFKMRGACSMKAETGLRHEEPGGPLAWAFTSDGDVLHFGEVQCDRVRESLQRVLGRSSTLKTQQTYGSALAIVIAHEVYHMLVNAKGHTSRGLTKPSLSAEELSSDTLAMPTDALSALRNKLR